MIVYLFKFDRETAESGANNKLLNFISSLLVTTDDIFDYVPSKNKVVLGVQTSIYKELCDYIRDNVAYDFEFEEHSDEERSLTQFTTKHKSFSVQYLLPLFSPESVLEL